MLISLKTFFVLMYPVSKLKFKDWRAWEVVFLGIFLVFEGRALGYFFPRSQPKELCLQLSYDPPVVY